MSSDSTHAPRVTVYIATYNYGKYLRQAVNSVLQQTYDPWELIIIDDGSTDETKEVLANFTGHPKVRIYSNQQNEGLTRTSNKAIQLARGEYVMRLDADDYLDENALLVLSNCLEHNLDIALVYPDYYVISEDGEILRLERRSRVYDEAELLDLPGPPPPPLHLWMNRVYDIEVKAGAAATSNSLRIRDIQYAVKVIGQIVAVQPQVATEALVALVQELLPLLGVHEAAQVIAKAREAAAQGQTPGSPQMALGQGAPAQAQAQVPRTRPPQQIRRAPSMQEMAGVV